MADRILNRVPVDKLEEIRDLLTERRHGNPARSPAHNARLLVDELLAAAPPAEAPAERGELLAEIARLEQMAESRLRAIEALQAAAPAAPAEGDRSDALEMAEEDAALEGEEAPRVTGGREAITGYVNGYLHGAQCVEFKADAPLPAWLTASPGLRVTLALQDANGGEG